MFSPRCCRDLVCFAWEICLKPAEAAEGRDYLLPSLKTSCLLRPTVTAEALGSVFTSLPPLAPAAACRGRAQMLSHLGSTTAVGANRVCALVPNVKVIQSLTE